MDPLFEHRTHAELKSERQRIVKMGLFQQRNETRQRRADREEISPIDSAGNPLKPAEGVLVLQLRLADLVA
jgi:hypothetical protein